MPIPAPTLVPAASAAPVDYDFPPGFRYIRVQVPCTPYTLAPTDMAAVEQMAPRQDKMPFIYAAFIASMILTRVDTALDLKKAGFPTYEMLMKALAALQVDVSESKEVSEKQNWAIALDTALTLWPLFVSTLQSASIGVVLELGIARSFFSLGPLPEVRALSKSPFEWPPEMLRLVLVSRALSGTWAQRATLVDPGSWGGKPASKE